MHSSKQIYVEHTYITCKNNCIDDSWIAFHMRRSQSECSRTVAIIAQIVSSYTEKPEEAKNWKNLGTGDFWGVWRISHGWTIVNPFGMKPILGLPHKHSYRFRATPSFPNKHPYESRLIADAALQ